MAQQGGSAARRMPTQQGGAARGPNPTRFPDNGSSANDNGQAASAQEIAFARGLSSSRLNDVRLAANDNSQGDGPANDNGDASQVSDSSDLSVTQPSSLEVPPKSSYDAGPEEETGFGEQISSLSEMQSQRAREAKMRKTSEQFTGAPSLSGAETPAGTSPSARKGSTQQTKETSTEPQGEVSPEDEIETAGRLATVQAIASLGKNLLRRREEEASQAGANEKENEKQLKKMWDVVTAANFGAGEAVFPMIFAVALMDLRVVNKISFRSKMVPDIDIPQMSFALFATCGCCLNCFWSFLAVLPLLVGAAVIATALIAIGNAVS